MTAAPTRCLSLLLRSPSISVSGSVVEPPVRVRRQSVRDPQPAVARPHLLPHANDAAARLRLHRTRHQEPGPSFHALSKLPSTRHSCLFPHRRRAFLFVLEPIKKKKKYSQSLVGCLCSTLIQKRTSKHWQNAPSISFFFYLYICEYTVNIPPTWCPVTLTRADAHTERLERVHSRASWMRNRLRRDGTGWGRL